MQDVENEAETNNQNDEMRDAGSVVKPEPKILREPIKGFRAGMLYLPHSFLHPCQNRKKSDEKLSLQPNRVDRRTRNRQCGIVRRDNYAGHGRQSLKVGM